MEVWTQRDHVAVEALRWLEWSPLRFKVGDILDQKGWIGHQANCRTVVPQGLAAAVLGRHPPANCYERRRWLPADGLTDLPGEFKVEWFMALRTSMPHTLHRTRLVRGMWARQCCIVRESIHVAKCCILNKIATFPSRAGNQYCLCSSGVTTSI